jgi:MraZ protein
MNRFLGRHAKRIDAKGRVSIPAVFRGVLTRDGYEGVFALRSLNAPAVDAGGHALIGEIDTLLSSYEPFSDEYQSLSIALLGGGDTLTLDAEGRIVMPDWIRAAADIKDDVVFVGQGSKFQIWSPDHFAEVEAKARAQAADIIKARGSRSVTGVGGA